MGKYKVAKVLAIKLDRKAQERRAKTKQMKYYASVAEKAVEDAEKKQQSTVVTKSKKSKKKKTNSKKSKKSKKGKKTKAAQVCHDCTTLPEEYKKQLTTYASGNSGAKRVGTCADCPNWAKDGYCTGKGGKFTPFMAKFCRGSCHQKNPHLKNCGTKK